MENIISHATHNQLLATNKNSKLRDVFFPLGTKYGSSICVYTYHSRCDTKLITYENETFLNIDIQKRSAKYCTQIVWATRDKFSGDFCTKYKVSRYVSQRIRAAMGTQRQTARPAVYKWWTGEECIRHSVPQLHYYSDSKAHNGDTLPSFLRFCHGFTVATDNKRTHAARLDFFGVECIFRVRLFNFSP